MSIGQPGTREAPQGQNRYVYLVMAIRWPAGSDFNDGYQICIGRPGAAFRAGPERSVPPGA